MTPYAAESQANLSETQATEIGTAAYIFGYPLVTMEVTRRVTTNTADPAGLRAPMGQFAHARRFPPPTYRDIPVPMPTRCTPQAGLTSPRNRTFSIFQKPRAATS
jgi:hypothetical protein